MKEKHLMSDDSFLPDPPIDPVKLAQMLKAIRANEYRPYEIRAAIEEFGDAHYWEAVPEMKKLLLHEDSDVRYSALEVLTLNFRLPELWENARTFLEHDPDSNCRMLGASCLERLKRNTGDERTLAVLARVAANEDERKLVRKVAYLAMRGVIAYDYDEQDTDILTFDLEKDVDWDLVRKYQHSSVD
jgi:HEAT repeat protein